MKSSYSLSFLFVILTFISCDPVLDIGIDFSASKDVVYLFCPGRSDNCVDTTIYFSKERLNLVKLSRSGNGHYSAFYAVGPGTLNSWFQYKWKADTVSLFLFDKETVDGSTWETIVEEYLVLQRYDVAEKICQVCFS